VVHESNGQYFARRELKAALTVAQEQRDEAFASRAQAGGAKAEADGLRRVASVMLQLLVGARARLLELERAFGGLAAREVSGAVRDAEPADAARLLTSDQFNGMLRHFRSVTDLPESPRAPRVASCRTSGAPSVAIAPADAPREGGNCAATVTGTGTGGGGGGGKSRPSSASAATGPRELKVLPKQRPSSSSGTRRPPPLHDPPPSTAATLLERTLLHHKPSVPPAHVPPPLPPAPSAASQPSLRPALMPRPPSAPSDAVQLHYVACSAAMQANAPCSSGSSPHLHSSQSAPAIRAAATTLSTGRSVPASDATVVLERPLTGQVAVRVAGHAVPAAEEIGVSGRGLSRGARRAGRRASGIG